MKTIPAIFHTSPQDSEREDFSNNPQPPIKKPKAIDITVFMRRNCPVLIATSYPSEREISRVRRGQEKCWPTRQTSIFRVEASVDRYFSHRVTGDTVWGGSPCNDECWV